MPKLSEELPSRYFKAVEFSDDKVYTIADVKIEKMGQGDDADKKPVVYFEETETGLPLNKTNRGVLTEAFGSDDTDVWIGRRIVLMRSKALFQGKMVPSIAVEVDKEPAAKKPAPKAPPAAPDDLAKLKREAFAAMQKKHPGADQAATVGHITAAVEKAFPGRKTTDLSASEWRELIDLGFEANPIEATVGDGSGDDTMSF